jgi:hypothetical protein
MSKVVVALLLLCPALYARSRKVELTGGYNHQNSSCRSHGASVTTTHQTAATPF